MHLQGLLYFLGSFIACHVILENRQIKKPAELYKSVSQKGPNRQHAKNGQSIYKKRKHFVNRIILRRM